MAEPKPGEKPKPLITLGDLPGISEQLEEKVAPTAEKEGGRKTEKLADGTVKVYRKDGTLECQEKDGIALYFDSTGKRPEMCVYEKEGITQFLNTRGEVVSCRDSKFQDFPISMKIDQLDINKTPEKRKYKRIDNNEDPNSLVIDFVYNNDERKVFERHYVRYATVEIFDRNGNVAKRLGIDGTRECYNEQGRLTEETDTEGNTKFFDENGTVVKIIDKQGEIKFMEKKKEGAKPEPIKIPPPPKFEKVKIDLPPKPKIPEPVPAPKAPPAPARPGETIRITLPPKEIPEPLELTPEEIREEEIASIKSEIGKTAILVLKERLGMGGEINESVLYNRLRNHLTDLQTRLKRTWFFGKGKLKQSIEDTEDACRQLDETIFMRELKGIDVSKLPATCKDLIYAEFVMLKKAIEGEKEKEKSEDDIYIKSYRENIESLKSDPVGVLSEMIETKERYINSSDADAFTEYKKEARARIRALKRAINALERARI